VVYAGRDPLTGGRHNVTETVDSYDDAEKALAKLLHQVDQNQHPKSSITLREAIEQWLEVAKLAELTRDRYEDLLRMHIGPRLGHIQAGRLDAELLERFYARLERCSQMCPARPPKGHVCTPMSTSTTRKIHYIIRGALGCAVRWKYLSVNVAEMVVAPSPAKTRPDPPSAAEAAALLGEALREPEWFVIIWLTMVTGCRRGELSALRWGDLDASGRLWIRRATIRPKSGVTEKGTKSGQDRRLSIDPHTMELLAEHRDRVAKQLAELGCAITEDTYMFSTTPHYSAPRLPHSITNKYRRMARRVGLRSTRIHALRHYSATELLAAGVDLRTVAGRLGHSGGGTTTLKVYAAWVEEADRKAADTMATIIPKPEPPKPRLRGPYEKIAQGLRNDIVSGLRKPGDQLPTIVQLATEYTVAAGTAHRAIALLHEEGLIAVTRGRRAVVVAAL
jgi:integrase